MGRAEALSLNTGMAKALERTKAVYEYLKNAGYGDRVQLDLGFTSHMGYYTDSVFKIYADGALYSMISGGRYDRLSAQFHAERPACGFGMNMNLLYEYMADKEMLEAAQPSADLAVLYDQASPELIRDINGWRKKDLRSSASIRPIPYRPMISASPSAGRTAVMKWTGSPHRRMRSRPA